MKTIKLLFLCFLLISMSLMSFSQTDNSNEDKTTSNTLHNDIDSQIIGSKASSESYIGTISMFAGNFAPVGWEFCNGQLMLIEDNEALFSILGNTYGGNGTTTFALPDLRGRVPIGVGTGTSLTTRLLGEMGGSERVSISESEMPAHSHVVTSTLNAAEEANSDEPQDHIIAGNGTARFSNTANATLMSSSISNQVANSGQGNSHYNMQPYLGINFIIHTTGVYPSHP